MGRSKQTGKRKQKKQAPPLRDPTVHELHNGPAREQLPEEVRNSARSETVCKFCGVSYLVFSEIKDLEKRLAATEEQLLQHRRKAQQFEALQQKVHDLVAHQQAQNEAHAALQQRAASLEACVYDREQAVQRAEREQCTMRAKISGVQRVLAREREAIRALKDSASRALKDMASLMQSTQHEVAVVSARLRREEETRLVAERELSTAQNMLEAEREAGARQDQQVAELRAAMTELEVQWTADVTRLEAQLAAARAATTDGDAAHARALQALEEALVHSSASLSRVTEQSEADKKAWLQERSQAQDRCQQAEERVSQLTQQVEAEIARVVQLEKDRTLQNANTKAAHDAKTAALQETVRQLKLSADGYGEEMRARLKRAEAGLAATRGQHRVEMDRLERELKALGEKADLYEKKAHAGEEAQRTSEGTIKDLRTKYDEVLARLRRAESGAGSAEIERSAELAAAKAHYNAELAALRDQLERVPVLKAALASTKNDLAVEASKALRFERAATAAQDALHTTKRDLTKLLDARADDCGRLKSRLAELEGRFAHLEKDNARLRKQVEAAPSAEDLAAAQQAARDATSKAEHVEGQLAEERKKGEEKDVSLEGEPHQRLGAGLGCFSFLDDVAASYFGFTDAFCFFLPPPILYNPQQSTKRSHEHEHTLAPTISAPHHSWKLPGCVKN